MRDIQVLIESDRRLSNSDVIVKGDRALIKRDSCLSNYYLCPVFYEGILYGSSESAFQAQKCIDEDLKFDFAMDSEWASPEESQAHGQEVELREDWEDIKDSVMFRVVLDKFMQNRDLADRLLLVKDYKIEEANGHGDTYWGTVDGKGENKLGKILNDVARVISFTRYLESKERM